MRRPRVIEVIDDRIADILRRKSGFERLAMADEMIRGARQLIESSVRHHHPDWDEQQVRREVARRIAGDHD